MKTGVEPASLSRRINAATIDTVIIVMVGFAIPQLLEVAFSVSGPMPLAWFYAALFLLEPALIRASGSTVGQALLGLRVVSTRPTQPLSFLRLTLRYWCKLVLGALSLFYILFSHQRLAIHDRLFGTAVFRIPRGSQAPAAVEPPTREPVTGLPSAPRRFAIFILWFVAGQFAVGLCIGLGSVAVGLATQGTVSETATSSTIEEVLAYAGSLLVLVVTAQLGSAGRLPGARKRSSTSQAA